MKQNKKITNIKNFTIGMRKYLFILILSFIISTPFAFAEVNNGFILDQIWYSSNSPKEGDTINIYSAVWNGSDNSLSVKVEFYDKNVVLGTRDFVVPSKKLQETSVSWKVTGGDHSISAKIISAVINNSNGKKEPITFDDNTTKIDKKFIPIVVKKEEGQDSTSSDLVKDELEKVGGKIEEILPESVNKKVSTGVSSVETFRGETLSKIIESKNETEQKIKELKDPQIGAYSDNTESATERPIAQVKLFFLKVLKVIFSNTIIFYGLIILFVLYIVRGIYRKIRNR
jgi:hypothetical protein